MPDDQPLVSVIMNCFNGEKYLREAIDSVYSQTYNNWEIIFWDNASTDSSAEIAKSYDEKLRYFRGEETIPLGAARNKAIEQAKGEFIAFLDCDDLWMPEKLEKQIPLFDHPEVGLTYSDCYLIRGDGSLIKTWFQTDSPPRGSAFRDLLLRNYIILSTSIIRRDCLKQAGLFNIDYNLSEEYDLFLRIAYRYLLDYVSEPLGKYRIHGTNWSLLYERKLAREGFEVLEKWRGVERVDSKDINSAHFVNAVDKLWKYVKQKDGRAFYITLREIISLVQSYGLKSFDFRRIFIWFKARIKNQLYFCCRLRNRCK